MDTLDILFTVCKLFGALALLIYGMKAMSDSLQKMAGPQLRHVLGRMTTNRFTGLLTGMSVTAAVQSSTATTVMTVSFVNAGLLTLAQAISVIMGANIGTTLTAWIISAGTSFNVTNLVWPAFAVALILIYRKRQASAGDFLFGLAFMILGLGTLRQTGVDMNLGEQEAVLHFFSSFDPYSYITTLLFLLIGGLLTMCVQSSAAVMAITMILCSSGALPIYQGIALVMGENIGTTVTSNLAALSASTQARRAAFAHMFFNLFGVCWMLVVFHPFVDMVCGMVGYDATLTRESGQEAFLSNASRLTVVLAMFHTCFNVANSAVLIWFIPQIERIVCRVIKDKPSHEEGPTRLQYIEGGLMQTPEVSVLQAQKETVHFSHRMQQMFVMVRELIRVKDAEDFNERFERIEKYEEIADNMESEIGGYLGRVSDAHLSDDTKAKIRAMLREVSEVESVGDACYNLARILRRRQELADDFTPEQYEAMDHMLQLVDTALAQACRVLENRIEEESPVPTIETERQINNLRRQLLSENIRAIDDHSYSFSLGTIYVDFINECEKLGDYIVNIVEARFGRSLEEPSSTSRQLYYRQLAVDLDQKTATIGGVPIALTPGEFDLLCLFLSSPGKVFSRKELIASAWPSDVIVSDRTVDVSVTRLRKKLGPLAATLTTRPGFGYGLEAE